MSKFSLDSFSVKKESAPKGKPRGFSTKAGPGSPQPMLLATAGLFVFLLIVSAVLLILNGKRAEPAPEMATVVIEKPAPIEMIDVIVPVRDIEAGQPIDLSAFTRVSLPRNAVPQNAVRVHEELDGMYAKANISAHQPIIRNALTKERPTNPVVVSIPAGHRAMTINVDALTGVEGWARAGAHVDVQWISDLDGKKGIVPLIRNARVLSADRRLDTEVEQGAPAPATVTLLVKESDVQRVTIAQGSGTLVLHLRGASSKNSEEDSGGGPVLLSDLFDKKGDMDKSLEGIAKIRGKDGKELQWAIVKGNIVKK